MRKLKENRPEKILMSARLRNADYPELQADPSRILCRAKPNGQNRPLYFRKDMEKLLRKMEKTTIIYKGNQTE